MDTDVLRFCGGSSIPWVGMITVLRALVVHQDDSVGDNQGHPIALERIASV